MVAIFAGGRNASAVYSPKTALRPMQVDMFTANPNAAIPDNTYNGTLGSMSCSTIDTTSLPNPSTVNDVSVQVAMSHTFVGDLTIKLVSPSGTILGLVSRPGVNETADNGNDTAGFGENSNLVIGSPLTYIDTASASAEQMGRTPVDLSTGQTICVDGGTPCSYTPAPGTVAGLSNFAGYVGENARGNWQLCIGDSASADTGTFSSWTLTLTSSGPTAANAPISGRVLDTAGRGIGRALVTISGPGITTPRLTLTNPFGYYSFNDLPVGETYVLSVSSKEYVFANPTRLINLNDSVTDADFIGNIQ